jgi:hypothetical protein
VTDNWNTSAVDKFLRTVKTAKDFNSKEVKLTIQDAEALALSLALILNQERNLAQKLLQCQENLVNSVKSNSAPNNLNLNGGGFS